MNSKDVGNEINPEDVDSTNPEGVGGATTSDAGNTKSSVDVGNVPDSVDVGDVPDSEDVGDGGGAVRSDPV